MPSKTPPQLDSYLNTPDRLLVQTTQMGSTEAYIGTASLEWVARRIGFASQLPLFQPHLDSATQNLDRNATTLDSIYQRPLDWSRQAPLAQYLATRPTHKFPPILVVLSPKWVDSPTALEWDDAGCATQSAADFLPLDSQNRIGLLSLPPDLSLFALDGQHRLMGIQGLMQWLQTGALQPYNKAKKPIGTPITLELPPSLAAETIGIEFVPAVQPGETRDEARQRIRSIFIHVNLMAVPLSKGQLALLDEDDGFSIITRQLAVTHPLLREEPGRNPRINWDSATVATKSTVLTTLQALKDMAQRYLLYKFPHWHSAAETGLIPLRPSEGELADGLTAFGQLFDGLASLPSYRRIDEGWETPKLRRFSFEKNGGEGNLLFRPIGQIAIAQALGVLVYRQKVEIEAVFEKLHRYDTLGGFSRMENPESLWYGVLYDPNKRRVRVAGRDLAMKLLVYLLGGMGDRMERAQLRNALADARTFENKAVSFDGRFVPPKEVGLPAILE